MLYPPKLLIGVDVSLTLVPKLEKLKDSNMLEEQSSNSMSQFAAYLKERENVELLETNTGFAIYLINGKECYIRDIWVKPECRQKGVASAIADQIAIKAKEAGCTFLTGSVSPTANNSTQSIQVLIGYGMRLHSSSAAGIIFIKDLE